MFAGETLEWQSFWDCFNAAVHRNPSIIGVLKERYGETQCTHAGTGGVKQSKQQPAITLL